jgi:two-component system, OmpR family, response regulator
VPRIFIVDDDPHIVELVDVLLRSEGYETLTAQDGEAALEMLQTTTVDLAILDIMMPRLDGLELCHLLRGHYDLPILILTAKGEPRDRVQGFTQGADDYLVKPFHPDELVLRVGALLRRYKIATSMTIELGNLTIDYQNAVLRHGGETFAIPPKELELLFKLASYPGQTFTREQLIEQIWGYDYEGDERTVDVHIKRLRERFSAGGYDFQIKTVRGLGYRLEVG